MISFDELDEARLPNESGPEQSTFVVRNIMMFLIYHIERFTIKLISNEQFLN